MSTAQTFSLQAPQALQSNISSSIIPKTQSINHWIPEAESKQYICVIA